MGSLGLYQELESLGNGAEAEEGAAASRLLQGCR